MHINDPLTERIIGCGVAVHRALGTRTDRSYVRSRVLHRTGGSRSHLHSSASRPYLLQRRSHRGVPAGLGGCRQGGRRNQECRSPDRTTSGATARVYAHPVYASGITPQFQWRSPSHRYQTALDLNSIPQRLGASVCRKCLSASVCRTNTRCYNANFLMASAKPASS